MNTPVTKAYKIYYGNKLAGTNHLIDKWGQDPSRFETQINCLKMGSKIADTSKYSIESEWGTETFGPQRWPYDAATNPQYSDPPITYNIAARMQAIGTTWWNWKNKQSFALGFDFDSIVGHSVGISDELIAKLDQIDVPWLEVSRSTRGSGRHIYIWFQEPFPVTQNHTEHAALARSFIPLIARYTGLDIEANVDVCGGVMWIYHIEATELGYKLIKPATQILTADHVPPNWRDNIEVVNGSRAKVRVQGWTPNGTTSGDELDEMTQAYAKVPLDEVHLKILEDLERTGHSSLWVHDHHLWQGHTGGLKAVYNEWAERGTPMKGLFDTNSHESDPGKPNCFCRPKPNGGWDVYRFGEGTEECELWDKQGKWTHTTYNYPATLRQICSSTGGFEASDPKLGFCFNTIDDIEKALELLGTKLRIPRGVTDDGRTFSLRLREDGKIILVISKGRGDKPNMFPRYSKTVKGWERVIDDAIETPDKENEDSEIWNELDDKFRCLKNEKQFDSWVLKDETEEWVTQPRENIKSALVATGFAKPEPIIGTAIIRSWKIINLPFSPEYPGGRVWNRNAPQFIYPPVDLKGDEVPLHPHWDMLMNHCGAELDHYIPKLPWCKQWGFERGGDYLKAWVAIMFQKPFTQLPYLFMYGPQNCGKSSFHEAIRLLITRGVESADRALTSKGGYNGELEDIVLAVVDEVDISKAGTDAYNKLKEWVTALNISIHPKYKQPKMVKNTLHFVQMANERSSLPVFPGDTRITAMAVPELECEIPKDILQENLKLEAPHFMRTLLSWEIYPQTGRLALPVIETQGKLDAAAVNMNELDRFIIEKCHYIPGAIMTFKEFSLKFRSELEEYQLSDWTEHAIRRRLSERFPIGRVGGNVSAIGNISFTDCEPKVPYVLLGTRLMREGEDD